MDFPQDMFDITMARVIRDDEPSPERLQSTTAF